MEDQVSRKRKNHSQFFCELCGVALQSERSLDEHYRGKRHSRNLAKGIWRKLLLFPVHLGVIQVREEIESLEH